MFYFVLIVCTKKDTYFCRCLFDWILFIFLGIKIAPFSLGCLWLH
uniref:Uncharacterized protein n=1 Tax=Siphoviridae sp. cttFh17 TaxID=2826491 RepID=A0A8S5NJJ9_9CAUD|nr:MAG TPA: hypothetical protein [Siphoviridae sp. cttFh17]